VEEHFGLKNIAKIWGYNFGKNVEKIWGDHFSKNIEKI
jgi:hypothetical protein